MSDSRYLSILPCRQPCNHPAEVPLSMARANRRDYPRTSGLNTTLERDAVDLLTDVFPMLSIYKILSLLLHFLELYLSSPFLYIDFTYIQMPEESSLSRLCSGCHGMDPRTKYPCSSLWSGRTKPGKVSVGPKTTNIGIRGRWNWSTGGFRCLGMRARRALSP